MWVECMWVERCCWGAHKALHQGDGMPRRSAHTGAVAQLHEVGFMPTSFKLVAAADWTHRHVWPGGALLLLAVLYYGVFCE